jgi:hypothetical protein
MGIAAIHSTYIRALHNQDVGYDKVTYYDLMHRLWLNYGTITYAELHANLDTMELPWTTVLPIETVFTEPPPIAGAKPVPPLLDLPPAKRHKPSTGTIPGTLDDFHLAGRTGILPEAVSPPFGAPPPARQKSNTFLQSAVLVKSGAIFGAYSSLLASRLSSGIPLEQLCLANTRLN